MKKKSICNAIAKWSVLIDVLKSVLSTSSCRELLINQKSSLIFINVRFCLHVKRAVAGFLILQYQLFNFST